MQFEVIKKSHKKEVVIGVVAIILIAVVLLVRNSFAKYQTIKNLKIAEGTINYTVPDFKVMAMYKNDGEEDTPITTMPESGYTINIDKSYCTIDNINKVYNKMYTDEFGQHIITGLEKNSKCYIFFDKEVKASDTILAGITVKESPDSFTGVATTDEGVFKTQDDDGDTYYFRGAVENNYFKFAGKYWRIIRINGDGTIRLIYDGESARENGVPFNASTYLFNSSYNNNMYVGFKYTNNEVHGIETESTILRILNSWYTTNLDKEGIKDKIDPNAGFCNDREPSTSSTTSNGSGGMGITTTYYGAHIRFIPGESWGTILKPTFKCKNSSDLFTKVGATKKDGTANGNRSLTNPIGLITADEVVYAGGFGGKANSSYYLYTGQAYWTISPSNYNNVVGYTYIFYVYSDGHLNAGALNNSFGYRPVINLRSDVELTGTGTASDPYVVQ